MEEFSRRYQANSLILLVGFEFLKGGEIILNIEIILGMAKPYVKDGAITYDEFDHIYSMLTRKEQYDVVEILFANGINLIDEHLKDTDLLLDIDHDELDDGREDDFEVLYDDTLFKDVKNASSAAENLIIHKEIRQSNEVLCVLIQQGNQQAAQDLCVKNRKLVDKYAAAYEKYRHNRLDFEDLEQAGFLGLLRAASNFNAQLGASFTTYAVYWIKQSIAREILENGYIIRIPVHMMERINKVMAAYNRLAVEETSLRQTIIQIAEELGLSEEMVRESLALKENVIGYTSLDIPVGEDGDSVLLDFIPADEEDTADQLLMKDLLREEIEKVLHTLNPREEQIIRMRFGLDDGVQRTLEEIAKEFDITRERIRQIETKALRKMRHPSRARLLRCFMEE